MGKEGKFKFPIGTEGWKLKFDIEASIKWKLANQKLPSMEIIIKEVTSFIFQ